MRKYYDIVLTKDEIAELSCGYAVAYTISIGEDALADYAISNFNSGNKQIQKSLADKIQLILKLCEDNAEETV